MEVIPIAKTATLSRTQPVCYGPGPRSSASGKPAPTRLTIPIAASKRDAEREREWVNEGSGEKREGRARDRCDLFDGCCAVRRRGELEDSRTVEKLLGGEREVSARSRESE